MAKPSKRKWAVEKIKRRILAQQEKAQCVANRLLGFSRQRFIAVDSSSGAGSTRTWWLKQNRRGTAIDHIDGDPFNNAPSNLRVVTSSQNRR